MVLRGELDVNWLKPPSDRTFTWWQVAVVEDKIAFPGQKKVTPLKSKFTLEDIVSKRAFEGLNNGFYVVKPFCRIVAGPQKGMAPIGKVLFWVCVNGSRKQDLLFFEFERGDGKGIRNPPKL